MTSLTCFHLCDTQTETLGALPQLTAFTSVLITLMRHLVYCLDRLPQHVPRLRFLEVTLQHTPSRCASWLVAPAGLLDLSAGLTLPTLATPETGLLAESSGVAPPRGRMRSSVRCLALR